MKTVNVNDRRFELSVPALEIQRAISAMAKRINLDYRDQSPLFLGVLNGAFMFAADLLREISIPCEISFIKYSSYAGTASTQEVKSLIGMNEDIRGRDIIILEDIIDTGLSVDHILREVKQFEPASIRIAALFFKPEALKKTFTPDYIGLSIPNDFIVGYGLDYDGFGRNLADVYKVISEQ
ncbi:MAG: hypoxanthine phosphoribosyltransferase [Bacteroidetes bacterium]|nr:hypoxanthine phosphoribosyltransferase [Bacteroidota bacterium]